MISGKHLLLPVVAFGLVIGISLAQGPKKDIGTQVPLPPDANPDKDNRPPQKTAGLPRADALSVDVDLVDVEVVVTDIDGNPVPGLTKDAFKIFDDNVQQQITNFTLTEAPLTIAFLLEFGEAISPRLTIPRVAGFIDSLRSDDWGALVTYDRHPAIVTDFTKNRGDLMNGLANLFVPRYPETCLNDALYDTLDRMENMDGRKAIIFVGTGLERCDFTSHSYPDALKKTEASDTPVYALSLAHIPAGLFGGNIHPARSQFTTGSFAIPEQQPRFLQADTALSYFASNSGGMAFFPKFAQELPGIYKTVFAQLRNQYSVGFVPTNRKTDGKFHKLRVEVDPADLNHDGKNHKLKVRHKLGYYAPKS